LEGREAPQAQNGHARLQTDLDVSIVMPCLNEEAAIAACVETALLSLSDLNMSGEVVVVDNDSSDRSAKLARAAGARVVREPVRGYGMAYLKGLTEAHGKYLVLGDSDGTYDFAALSSFVEPLLNGTDLVIGSRLRGVIDPGAMPWLHRYVGNPALTKAMNLLFASDSTDVYCGMRSVKRETLSRMTLAAPGMEFALEMLIQAFEHGARVKEVPIRYGRRIGGTPKLRTWRDGWRSLRFIIRESGRVRSERSPSILSLSAQGGAAPSEAEL
jgi:glycosyltransferase involved in cell wall biosynthesis